MLTIDFIGSDHVYGKIKYLSWIDGGWEGDNFRRAHRASSNQDDGILSGPGAGAIVAKAPGFGEFLPWFHLCIIWDSYICDELGRICTWCRGLLKRNERYLARIGGGEGRERRDNAC